MKSWTQRGIFFVVVVALALAVVGWLYFHPGYLPQVPGAVLVSATTETINRRFATRRFDSGCSLG